MRKTEKIIHSAVTEAVVLQFVIQGRLSILDFPVCQIHSEWILVGFLPCIVGPKKEENTTKKYLIC